ncbi:thermonuclease family protein [Candidatus Bipolaricaulota bacterium]|nr:thermonuclease family protein [Candidatus Bipolaricaulota bacterium]
MLLALYALSRAEEPPTTTEEGSTGAAIAVGRVIYVVDGDTFYVEYITGGEGLPISIRTYLASTPEVHRRPPECYGAEAEEYAWQLLFGRTVWLVHYGRLSHDRLLAFVYLDPEKLSLFQAVMIAQGFAKADIIHPEEDRFEAQMIRLEDEARSAGRGRWSACR